MKKIVVVGLGYVGAACAAVLAQDNFVIGVDLCPKRVNAINSKKSPISDNNLSEFLEVETLNLSATVDLKAALDGADYVVLALPTDYDEQLDRFNTDALDAVIETCLHVAPHSHLIIKSTIPVGYVDNVRSNFGVSNIVFVPEFLREGQALYDTLYPSRIVIGGNCCAARFFGEILLASSRKKDVQILHTGTREAESIKLFSNSYLAMRVAFFNELDTYALEHNLDTRGIIDGVCLDPRIGKGYNNPSFGYGGYCLPKDTKQLLSNFREIPNKLISAVVSSNELRKKVITNYVLKKKPGVVGAYRLIMKNGSENFRGSAIQDIINMIANSGVKIVIYEPKIKTVALDGIEIVNDLEKFKSISDVILTNRLASELEDVTYKVFTRDVFGEN